MTESDYRIGSLPKFSVIRGIIAVLHCMTAKCVFDHSVVQIVCTVCVCLIGQIFCFDKIIAAIILRSLRWFDSAPENRSEGPTLIFHTAPPLVFSREVRVTTSLTPFSISFYAPQHSFSNYDRLFCDS